MRRLCFLLAMLLGLSLIPATLAQAQGNKPRPPSRAKKHKLPPGQTKRGCLPPGLAKKFGVKPPCKVYVAVDPKQRDRVWFLVDDTWVLETGLAEAAQVELKAALELDLPKPPDPPIPLPKVAADLHIMLFDE